MSTEQKTYPLEFDQLAAASERAGFAYGIALMDYQRARKEDRDDAEELGRIMNAREENARALKLAVIAAFRNEQADATLARIKRESGAVTS